MGCSQLLHKTPVAQDEKPISRRLVEHTNSEASAKRVKNLGDESSSDTGDDEKRDALDSDG